MGLRAGRISHWAIFTIVSIGLCAGFAAWGAGREPAKNPHWKPDGCADCHQIAGGKAQPIAAVAVDAVCLKCHDGKAARAEVHPVGVAMKRSTTRPLSWPTAEGRVSCITCHDIKQGCDAKAARKPANPTMLRLPESGAEGFCRTCHSPQQFPKRNPHQMLAADRKEIVAEQCLFCHTEVPDRGAMARSRDPKLRAEPALQCRSCHPVHQDAAPRGHNGAQPTENMIALMCAREVVGLTGPPPTDLVAQFKVAKAKPTQMPLGPGRQVTCATCHNPHQAGVFPAASPLAQGTMRMVEGRIKSPVRGQTWCNHCHQL